MGDPWDGWASALVSAGFGGAVAAVFAVELTTKRNRRLTREGEARSAAAASIEISTAFLELWSSDPDRRKIRSERPMAQFRWGAALAGKTPQVAHIEHRFIQDVEAMQDGVLSHIEELRGATKREAAEAALRKIARPPQALNASLGNWIALGEYVPAAEAVDKADPTVPKAADSATESEAPPDA